MVNIEDVEYIVSEINEKRNIPYQMANEQMLDEFFPELKKRLPELEVFKCGIDQWLIVSEKAKKRLAKQLQKRMEKLEQSVNELKLAIEEICS